ncbi:helix-turn-helix transcriptional regulator [Streptomyces buecherae]|uniref:helix-turn-helix transcriptional regulator n=1 Tax=Streptomyces buecherae TaxID=2763006 RepID=UPI00379ED79A
MPSARSGPTIAQRLLCATLREMRERAQMTPAEAAEKLGAARTTVSRLEAAETGPRPATVRRLLEIYSSRRINGRRVVTAAERDQALRDLEAAQVPGWWHAYRDVLPPQIHGVLDLESAAEVIRIYAPGVVPDLLQCPDYARALLRARAPRESEEVIDRRLELVLARQRHSIARTNPPPVRLWVLLEESALHRPVGGPKVMRAQRSHLEELIARRGPVTVQVVPTAAGPHPMTSSGSIGLLRFHHPVLEDRLIVRGLRTEATTDPELVGAAQAAMDLSAALAPPPTTPLPPLPDYLEARDER